VGYCGGILNFDGATWRTFLNVPWVDLYGVGGVSAADVFAVGQDFVAGTGVILHYDGVCWSSMPSGTSDDLNCVWGSADDVFAVGEGGTILHFDRASWTPMDSGTSADLGGVWGSARDDVFVVGRQGTICHYDGTRWSPMTSGVHYNLWSAWGSSANDLFAVGSYGTIIHYAPATGATLHLNSSWFGPGDTFLLDVTVQNLAAEELTADLYVLLDPGIGDYWFWPGWAHWPPDMDSASLSLGAGEQRTFTVLNFPWRDTGLSSMSGVSFWGALVDATYSVVGEIGHVEFSFGP
jgi:hypothetical protein